MWRAAGGGGRGAGVRRVGGWLVQGGWVELPVCSLNGKHAAGAARHMWCALSRCPVPLHALAFSSRCVRTLSRPLLLLPLLLPPFHLQDNTPGCTMEVNTLGWRCVAIAKRNQGTPAA